MNKRLNFGGDTDHSLDTAIVFGIRHYWQIQKVVNGHSLLLIRQMAALVRRALAEVCTVPVLFVEPDSDVSAAIQQIVHVFRIHSLRCRILFDGSGAIFTNTVSPPYSSV